MILRNVDPDKVVWDICDFKMIAQFSELLCLCVCLLLRLFIFNFCNYSGYYQSAMKQLPVAMAGKEVEESTDADHIGIGERKKEDCSKETMNASDSYLA